MADTDYVPVGALVPLGCSLSEDDPSFKLCNGDELDATAYAELFSAIGRTYGGDESRQVFNLPDLQGMFPRGAAHKSGNDPDVRTRDRASGSSAVVDGVGMKQGHATAAPGTPFTCAVDLPSGTSRQHGETVGGVMKEGGSKTIQTCDGGDEDTRPVNVYVNYYIKYQS